MMPVKNFLLYAVFLRKLQPVVSPCCDLINMSHVWRVSYYMVKATGSKSSWGNRSFSGASVVASQMSFWAWCLVLHCWPEPGNVSETFLIEFQFKGLNELLRKSLSFHLSIHYFQYFHSFICSLTR